MVPILIVVRVGLGLAHDGSTARNKDIVDLTTFHAMAPTEKNMSLTFGGSDVRKEINANEHDSQSYVGTQSQGQTGTRRGSTPPV